MSGLRERLEQLKTERDILRKRKKKVTPKLRAIEGLEEELEHYEKMDLDDSEKNSRRESRIKIKMRKTWKYCESSGDSSMSMKRNRGEKRAPREKGAIGLFVSESDDSGYESEVIEPVEASINPLSTTSSDRKDLCYTKRGRAYYVISQHGPDKGYKKYSARKASLHAIEKLDLKQLTELRPDPGTFRLTGIQGVVVAPDSDFRALLRKYWKIDTKKDIKKDIKKDETTKRKCPWIQFKVQYVDTADGKEDENKKTMHSLLQW
ncbi:hypothetical protein CRV24_002013 [Beauveria bassiana]|nr:hypothetical protein CRV24_002013 [Beauveria bassiana]KAH8717369.1 hypothetical protein HC256_002058 [Beauveria bassiana]